MRAVRAFAVFLIAVATAAQTAYAQTGADEPRDTGVREKVEVQLVLLDVTVVDKRREIVTGLTPQDFVLRVDNERTSIISLDTQCPAIPLAEPPAVTPGADGEWEAPDRERKIVLAVDYRHLEQVQRVDVLLQLREAVARLHRSREQLMIVALADFLRVELPFTVDGKEIERTLARMENDISLWLPPFDHLPDGPTFEALLQLTDLLATLDGDKVVVLYSNWPGSGFTYDALYDELASRAARGRVTFYPVWTRGLQPRGTSRRLARLAVETGGRFTERTNDFSLGYARAQRDTACRYTIGFQDSGEDPVRVRRVDLRVKRRGVRVHYPDRYAFGDPESRREAIADAILAWPARYASDSIQVALLPVRPITRKRWDAVLAVQAIDAHDERVRLRARLRRGNTRWRHAEESRFAPFSVSDPYRLRSGTYVASATASYPGEAQPRAAEHVVELQELKDDRGWWFDDPLVLRALGNGPVDPAVLEGTALEGDPLAGRVPVLSRATTGDALSLLATVCRYGAGDAVETVAAEFSVAAGDRVVFATGKPLKFPGGTKVRCAVLDETLPLLPPGRYSASVRLSFPEGPANERSHDFEIVRAEEVPD